MYFKLILLLTILLPKVVRFGECQVGAVPEGCFMGTPSAFDCLRQAENELQEISMNGIGLYRIENTEPGIFARFQHLTTLDLSNNFLQHLSFSVFQGALNLRVLRITGNQITVFDDVDRIPLLMPNLAELYISGNPVNCNCTVNALFELQEQRRLIRDAHLMRCATPPEWKGLPFSQMPVHFIYGECRNRPLWQLCGDVKNAHNMQLFPCFSGPKIICIPRTNVCDGIAQCPNAARDDENVFICRRLIQQQLEQQAKQPLSPASNPLIPGTVITSIPMSPPATPDLRIGGPKLNLPGGVGFGDVIGGGNSIFGVVGLGGNPVPTIGGSAAAPPPPTPTSSSTTGLLAPTINAIPTGLSHHHHHHHQHYPSVISRHPPSPPSPMPAAQQPAPQLPQPPAPVCAPGFLVCGLSSSVCVLLGKFCNGIADCPNGFDEMQQNCNIGGNGATTILPELEGRGFGGGGGVPPVTLPPDVVMFDVEQHLKGSESSPTAVPQPTTTVLYELFSTTTTTKSTTTTAAATTTTMVPPRAVVPVNTTTSSSATTLSSRTLATTTTTSVIHEESSSGLTTPAIETTTPSAPAPTPSPLATPILTSTTLRQKLLSTSSAVFGAAAAADPAIVSTNLNSTAKPVSISTTTTPTTLKPKSAAKSNTGSGGGGGGRVVKRILKQQQQPQQQSRSSSKIFTSSSSSSSASSSTIQSVAPVLVVAGENSSSTKMPSTPVIEIISAGGVDAIQSNNNTRSTVISIPPKNFKQIPVNFHQNAGGAAAAAAGGAKKSSSSQPRVNRDPPLLSSSIDGGVVVGSSATHQSSRDPPPQMPPPPPPVAPFNANTNDDVSSGNSYHSHTMAMPPPKVFTIYREDALAAFSPPFDAAEDHMPPSPPTLPPTTSTTTTSQPRLPPDDALKPADVRVEVLDLANHPDRLTVYWSKTSAARRAAAGYWQPKAYKVLYCTLWRGQVMDRDMSPLLSSMVYEYTFTIKPPDQQQQQVDAVKIMVQALYVDVEEQQHYFESFPIVYTLLEPLGLPAITILDTKSPTAALTSYVAAPTTSTAMLLAKSSPTTRNGHHNNNHHHSHSSSSSHLSSYTTTNRWQNFSNMVGLTVGGVLVAIFVIGVLMFLHRRFSFGELCCRRQNKSSTSTAASMLSSLSKNSPRRRGGTQRMKKLKRGSTSSRRPIANMSSIGSDQIYAEPDYAGMPNDGAADDLSSDRGSSARQQQSPPLPQLASIPHHHPSSLLPLVHQQQQLHQQNMLSNHSPLFLFAHANPSSGTNMLNGQRAPAAATNTATPIPLTTLGSTFVMPQSLTAAHQPQLQNLHFGGNNVAATHPDHSYLQVIEENSGAPPQQHQHHAQHHFQQQQRPSQAPPPLPPLAFFLSNSSGGSSNADNNNNNVAGGAARLSSSTPQFVPLHHHHAATASNSYSNSNNIIYAASGADGSIGMNSASYYYVMAPGPNATPVMEHRINHLRSSAAVDSQQERRQRSSPTRRESNRVKTLNSNGTLSKGSRSKAATRERERAQRRGQNSFCDDEDDDGDDEIGAPPLSIGRAAAAVSVARRHSKHKKIPLCQTATTSTLVANTDNNNNNNDDDGIHSTSAYYEEADSHRHHKHHQQHQQDRRKQTSFITASQPFATSVATPPPNSAGASVA